MNDAGFWRGLRWQNWAAMQPPPANLRATQPFRRLWSARGRGNGGHVWIFPLCGGRSATMARQVGAHVLTETMEQGRNLGFVGMTGSFRIRTRCRRADSAQSHASVAKKRRVTVDSLFVDETLAPHPINGLLARDGAMPMQRLEQFGARSGRGGRVIHVLWLCPRRSADTQPWMLPRPCPISFAGAMPTA